MAYEVFCKETGAVHTRTYMYRKHAINRANKYTEETGILWKIRRAQPTDEWKDRERGKFESGVYTKVPWHDESWFTEEHFNTYFTHMSLEQEGHIAYTYDAFKGEDDIQTSTTPGRYLTKFFRDHLTDDEINYWCAKVLEWRYELVILTNPDDIAAAYTSGDGMAACMSHSTSRYYTNGIHPTTAYGEPGDIMLAVLNDKVKKKYVARALVWPEKKLYGRVYGHTQGITQALENQGYKNDWFYGAKIRAQLVPKSDGDSYVCPYLDGPTSGWQSHVRLKGEFFIYTNRGDDHRNFVSGSTSGVVSIDVRTCTNCGDKVSSFRYNDKDQEVCTDCVEQHGEGILYTSEKSTTDTKKFVRPVYIQTRLSDDEAIDLLRDIVYNQSREKADYLLTWRKTPQGRDFWWRFCDNCGNDEEDAIASTFLENLLEQWLAVREG